MDAREALAPHYAPASRASFTDQILLPWHVAAVSVRNLSQKGRSWGYEHIADGYLDATRRGNH